jgi:hypothetical protein
MSPILRATALVGAVVLTGAARADAQTLPPADQLIARHVQAIGGREAVLRPVPSRTAGSFEIPAAGLSGTLEVIALPPVRNHTRVEIPGLGTIRSGYDGTVAWSVDPMMGARVFAGAELEAAAENANPLAAVRDPSVFPTRETVERTEMGGEACYRVRLVSVSGRESFDCYHVDTGLLVGTVSTQQSPMGSTRVSTFLSEYREFGGVRMPSRITQDMGGMQQIISITAVTYEGVTDADVALPADIHALLGH